MRRQIIVKSNYPEDVETFQKRYCEAITNILTTAQIEERKQILEKHLKNK